MNLFQTPSNRGARSLQIFGLYLCGAGSLLLLAPALLVAPLALPAQPEVWIRLAGILALALGWSDLQSARCGDLRLIRASVWRRGTAAAAIVLLILGGVAPPALALFAAVDFAAAAWTARVLRTPTMPSPVQA